MKLTKKIIILLLIMASALVLGMSKVYAIDQSLNAKESLNFNTYNSSWHWQCVQQHQWLLGSESRDYKCIARIKISDNFNARIWTTSDPSGRKSIEDENDYNKKLATAILKLEHDSDVGNKENKASRLQEYIWGFFEDWNNNIGKQGHIPQNFATKKPNSVYSKIKREVNEYLDNYTEFKFEKDKAKWMKKTINNTQYDRYGPYKLNDAVMEAGLESFKVTDKDGNKLSMGEDFTIWQFSEGKWKKITDYNKIQGNKNFYICVPREKNISGIKGTIKTEKQTRKVLEEAELYLWETTYSWQNLIYVDGEEKTEEIQKTYEFELDRGSGSLQPFIVKRDLMNGEPLEGAQFIVCYMAQVMQGSTTVNYPASYVSINSIPEEERAQYTQRIGQFVYINADKNKEDLIERWNFPPTYQKYQVANDGTTDPSVSWSDAKNSQNYIHTTNKNGEIILSKVYANVSYFAMEIKAPNDYKLQQENQWSEEIPTDNDGTTDNNGVANGVFMKRLEVTNSCTR